MSVILEACEAAGFRFVRIHRESVVVAPAGMGDMIDAAAERAPGPGVDNVECQRRVDRNRRMQTRGGFPRFEANAADAFACRAGRAHRHAPSVAGDDVAVRHISLRLHLQALDGGIDKTHSAAGNAFFAEHMPGLERLTDFELHAAMLDRAAKRKAELALRFEPTGIEFVTRGAEIA